MLEAIDSSAQLGISPHRALGGHHHSLGESADVTTKRLGDDIEVPARAVLRLDDQVANLPELDARTILGCRDPGVNLLELRAHAVLDGREPAPNLLELRARAALGFR